LTRRQTLQAGALSLLGGFFNLPSLLALEGRRDRAIRPGKARSVILMYLQGGPATQDMVDLKPRAPDGIASQFRPIATTAPGIQVCEHLPRMARWMHKAVVVRSVYHTGGCHNNLPPFTGYDEVAGVELARPTDPPSLGSVCAYHQRVVLQEEPGALPSYVYLPHPLGWGEFKNKNGPGAGFLGQPYDPLYTECKPYVDRPAAKADDMQVVRGEVFLGGKEFTPGMTLDRVLDRRSLLQQLDQQVRQVEAQPAAKRFQGQQQLAFDLLTSSTIRAAFDLSQEPEPLRARYGRTLFGASALLARRLVERGVRFVTVSWDNLRERFFPQPLTNQVWDTHERNFPILREHLLPSLDQTCATLIEDLEQRGLLDETLLVVMGEMGRTPRINKDGGRDHWTNCYSVLLAGAGLQGGSVYGASDADAAFIKDRPARIRDICATIYHCLGIDPELAIYDRGGRPIPVAHGGQPLREILA
jgi:hypothetical protein